MLDRTKLKQPYNLADYIRTSHSPEGVFLTDGMHSSLAGFISNHPEKWITGEGRISAAKLRVHSKRFFGGVLGEMIYGPVVQPATDNPYNREAIGLLRKNASKLSDGFELLKWFMDPGVYLAGGAIVAATLGAEIKDLDFFFRDKKTRLEFQKFVMAEGYAPVSVTSNAVTLTKDGHKPIQLVFNHYFDYPEFCILAFDWSPAQCAIFYSGPSSTVPASLGNLSFTCAQRWAESMIDKSMVFNSTSLGSRHSSFFRALKYREKYGFAIYPWNLDRSFPVLTPSSLLNPEKEAYGIPKPWNLLWTAPDFVKNQDVLGSVVDLAGSPYDNTLYLQWKIGKLIDSHRSSWSVASSRRICHEIELAIEESKHSEFLSIDRSILEECKDPDRTFYDTGTNKSVYNLIVDYCKTATPDKSFSVLLKMSMSMEIACETEYEELLKEGQCQS